MDTKTKQLWQAFTEDIKSIYAEKLLQLALYNLESPTGNLIIVVDKTEAKTILEKAVLFKRHLKKLPLPLIVDLDYLKTSLDSFPLEFLNLTPYENIFVKKDDVLKTLKFDKNDVRLQMEREIKGKWVLVRSALLNNYDNKQALHELTFAAMNSIIPILKGLLFLEGKNFGSDTNEIIKVADDLTSFSLAPFYKGLSLMHTKAPKLDESRDFFIGLIELLKEFMNYVDTYKV